MNETMVWVYQVQTPMGERHFVSLLPPERMPASGRIAQAIIGKITHPPQVGELIDPESFEPNPTFVEFLHSLIARVGPNLPGLIAEAKKLTDGWVDLIDLRTPTPDGDVPSDDIIGAFQVRGGQIIEGSYKTCPDYRFVTDRGFLRLNEDLMRLLLEELDRLP